MPSVQGDPPEKVEKSLPIYEFSVDSLGFGAGMTGFCGFGAGFTGLGAVCPGIFRTGGGFFVGTPSFGFAGTFEDRLGTGVVRRVGVGTPN